MAVRGNVDIDPDYKKYSYWNNNFSDFITRPPSTHGCLVLCFTFDVMAQLHALQIRITLSGRSVV